MVSEPLGGTMLPPPLDPPLAHLCPKVQAWLGSAWLSSGLGSVLDSTC